MCRCACRLRCLRRAALACLPQFWCRLLPRPSSPAVTACDGKVDIVYYGWTAASIDDHTAIWNVYDSRLSGGSWTINKVGNRARLRAIAAHDNPLMRLLEPDRAKIRLPAMCPSSAIACTSRARAMTSTPARVSFASAQPTIYALRVETQAQRWCNE
jgi:hypothetical protein